MTCRSLRLHDHINKVLLLPESMTGTLQNLFRQNWEPTKFGVVPDLGVDCQGHIAPPILLCRTDAEGTTQPG